MNKEKFTEDLQIIYNELQKRQNTLNGYYKLVEERHEEAAEVVGAFLSSLELKDTKENIMAALTRIVSLREDALDQVLQKSGFTQIEIMDKKEQAYMYVSHFHMERHASLISWIHDKKLLTPFYRTIISGVDAVGIAISGWQNAWTAHIINGVNRDLYEQFNGDEEKIFEKLQSENLLDLDSTGAVGDRCYSVLHQEKDGSYKRVAYAEAFKEEVEQIRQALKLFIDALRELEDEVYGQKVEWVTYLSTIYDAFGHTHPDELITYWANVDRAWMKVTTPIQLGHPLEYYEDHYRKAVALEWDLRIINPRLQRSSQTREHIYSFAKEMAENIGEEAGRIIGKNLTQVNGTQLYIGQPMLYYGAEFNGLFSAQVVPNDEAVSAELGKKIFAYADFVMESKKSKPVMKLSVETFGEAFVRSQRTLVCEHPQLWHEIYDIATIGHEFGHILWIDSDTEMKMNGTGQFKNIEEFKATAGGLMAFFDHEKEELKAHIVDDLILRAVGLMAWREVGEVLPYYCEGLIHLDILFKSGVIRYTDRIEIDYSRYDAMREGYITAYEKLARHYLDKKDAYGYLREYAEKLGGVFLPVDEKIRAFVEHYYKRYKEIGQETVVL